MSTSSLETRTPDEVGYLAWVIHRFSAVLLVLLLAIHIGVQLYPNYGFVAIYRWGIYGKLLDVTLGLLLLHGFLGVRATLLGLSMTDRMKKFVIWSLGVIAFSFFAFRIFV